MGKLNQEELLDIFDGVFSFYLGELGHEEDKVKIEQAKEQIKEMIQKPEVTEERIDEKAKETWNLWWYKASGKYATDFTGTIRFDFQGVKNLIRSLVGEIK